MRFALIVLAACTFSPALANAKLQRPSAIAKAEGAIVGTLRDPSSAQFRDVRIEGSCNGANYVTGWVNAKNGYGGYVGFTIFLVKIKSNAGTVMQAGGTTYATDAEFHTAAVCSGNASD
jgi:hypothetical protein